MEILDCSNLLTRSNFVIDFSNNITKRNFTYSKLIFSNEDYIIPATILIGSLIIGLL